MIKRLFSLITLIGCLVYSLQLPIDTFAQTREDLNIYTVQKDNTLFKLAIQLGVSEVELERINFRDDSSLAPGEKIIIPDSFTNEEKELLARLVHAEAKGEPHAGKVAVAQVVLNRVSDSDFPNTIHDVIYEQKQFQPVSNGMINEEANDKSIKAVEEAIALEGQGTGALYFFNPDLTNNKWLKSKKVTTIIGNHQFAK